MGSQSLPGILGRSEGQGIGLISNTDDDNMEACDTPPQLAAEVGISWIRGAQVTVLWNGRYLRDRARFKADLEAVLPLGFDGLEVYSGCHDEEMCAIARCCPAS